MSCQCKDAALRAYRELKGMGDSEGRAYDAAVRIFQHYHPESERIQAYETVGDWLDEHELVVSADCRPSGTPL